MTAADTETCRVKGAEYLPGDGDADAVCQRFTKRLRTGLDPENGADGLIVALTISRGGTISATMTMTGDGEPRSLPEVAVDVMDRPLNYSDLDRLADTAASVLNRNPSNGPTS